MSRNSHSVPTGKMCSASIVPSCKGKSPEYKHWPWLAELARPDDADPGPIAMQQSGNTYCILCHDCFESVWDGGE